ncbi:MAG TPA: hypothetical protein VIJ22_08785 [Polyangiaceae bacterium]
MPGSGFLAWTFRAGFERASSGPVDAGNGATADFTWTVGILDVCPTRWTLGALSLEPCVRAEAGVLEGAGGGIVPARDLKPPWVAVGPTGRARLFVAGPIFLELDAGARFPLTRTRYFFEPDETVDQPPVAGGWTAGAGLGVRVL